MYMMKLRYGDAFGKRGNSCWRLLFVLCLMPWMRKYCLQATLSSSEDLDVEIEQVEAELAVDDEGSTDDGPQGGVVTSLPPERRLQRAATKRKLQSMKNLKSLRNMNTATSREDFLEQENTLLRERIRHMTMQNQQLGGKESGSRQSLVGALSQWQGHETKLSLLGELVRGTSTEESEDELLFFDAEEEEALSRASTYSFSSYT